MPADEERPDELQRLQGKVAVACRILAYAGLSEDVLGHVSVRVRPDSFLVRCRGPAERGLLFTEPSDIRLLDAEGTVDSDRYDAPSELPIHLETMKTRADVDSVVHAHPPSVIAADLAGVALEPLVGAYNIPAAKMASEGIGVYERGVLINDAALAHEMIDALGQGPACVLRGHGITTVGATVEQAVSRALAVDSLARMACRVATLGARVVPLDDRDLAQLPDLGSHFNDVLLWRHWEARLQLAGLGGRAVTA